jgi:hypothetical protein
MQVSVGSNPTPSAKEPEKMSARILSWSEASLSLFCLLDFKIFGIIIILKD